MYSLLQNEHFWVYLAFIIFLIIFGKLIYKSLKSFLVEQIVTIESTINSSKAPLEDSLKKLKIQKTNFTLLNQKIQNLKNKDKELSNTIVEAFYENLATKVQYLEENFKTYVKNENFQHMYKLANILIDTSYKVTINLLSTQLSSTQRQNLVNESINKLEKVLDSNK